MTRRVILVGASGVFGARLARRACLWPDIELVLAARRTAPLEALRERLAAAGAVAELSVARVDRAAPSALADLSPWLVIDAAGPFQGCDYGLARAALEAGAHYVDLADARDFVAGFPAALDDLARAKGLLAVAGASSSPALTHAALDRMTAGWRSLETAWGAITPGAKAPLGLSAVKAALTWAGKPLKVFTGGGWASQPGWSEPRRIEMPGISRRWVVLAETTDLDLIPPRVTVDGRFFAGLEPPILHFGLWALAWLVRLGWVKTLAPAAAPLRWLAGFVTPFGSDRGGMVVTAEGIGADGGRRVARWSLAAGPGAGPATPPSPALAVARALLDGGLTRTGAQACVGLVSLEEITAQLSGLPIVTRIDRTAPDRPGLFPRLLGDAFDALPPQVREAHAGEVPARMTGKVVSHAHGWAAWLVRTIIGLPPRGRFDAAVEVTPAPKGENWVRTFGVHSFASRVRAAPGEMGAYAERLGPVTMRFVAEPGPTGFRWRQTGWAFLGLPLPAWIGPRVHAHSFAQDGRYHFSVLISHPLTGVVIAYAGRLEMTRP